MSAVPVTRGIDAASSVAAVSTPKPAVTPLGVYVARRNQFSAIVRTATYPGTVKSALFDELMLERHGWDFRTSRLSFLGHDTHGDAMWRLSRGAE